MIYIYCRVSTQGQAQKGDSIKGQIEQCNGWVAMALRTSEDIEVFEELAVSGSTKFRERPQGSIIFNRLKEGDVLICYKLDRLFRNSADAITTADDLKPLGVSLIMLNIGATDVTRDSIGMLILTVISACGQWERDTIVSRMVDAKAAKRARGMHVGGFAGYGFKVIPFENGKKRVQDEEQQQVIKVLVDLVENNKMSYVKIAAWMISELGVDNNYTTWNRIYNRRLRLPKEYLA